mmetsp:Transcript_24240/g.76270  ORF Transcript_24240/g.76270 Transcript_24240/m.76270 type:complete len:182 (+) Transcript_24240:80-625(+)
MADEKEVAVVEDKPLGDPEPDFSKKHPLEHAWTLWFDNPNGRSKQSTWGQTLRTVYTFSTVEDFWWCAGPTPGRGADSHSRCSWSRRPSVGGALARRARAVPTRTLSRPDTPRACARAACTTTSCPPAVSRTVPTSICSRRASSQSGRMPSARRVGSGTCRCPRATTRSCSTRCGCTRCSA